MKDGKARDRLKLLLEGQSLGVLATCRGDETHATLVAFAFTEDLRELFFATSRGTRKFRALLENPRVALLVDDRSNEVRDFHDASVVTAHGFAHEVDAARRDTLQSVYLEKHPYLEDFVRAPSCALVSIAVESYDLVWNFQEVHVLRIR
jgi:nitroimidazol reductase NimA-like FMN-containing flavoprotein (pyridoxamine 5'-phosphate oxidase superfamily)